VTSNREPVSGSRYSDWAAGWVVWGLKPAGARDSLLLRTSRLALGPPSHLFSGYVGYFPGVKRSEREVNLLPSSREKVKSECSYTSASPLYGFM
jgi:hypothetical protein